jgi:uncharacterized protein YcbK (DUF882 family)
MISQFFGRNEFCCHCGNCPQSTDPTVDIELIKILEDVRSHFHAPVTINSGMRCKSHNASCGGRPFSKHLEGKAADIVVKGVDPNIVFLYLTETHPDSFGIGKYNGFTHVDSRAVKARWEVS